MGKPKIIQNEVQCDNCGDIIHSASVHSCVQCSCGGVTVDGDMEYLRRLGHAQSYTERSMTLNETTINELSEYIEMMIETGRNPLGIACAVIRTLRDFGLLDERKFHPDYNDNPKSQSFVAGW